MGVVGEQHQGGQTGGTDGIALGDGLGGVAHGVQGIGDAADLLVQLGHLGDAAGVVRDGTEGIQGHDDAGHGEHGGGGDGDAVEARQLIAGPDGGAHDQHGGRGGFHGDAQTGDDVGGVPGLGCLGNVLHRLELGGRVVLGDDHHQGGQDQTDHGCAVEAPVGVFGATRRRVNHQGHGDEEHQGDDARDDQPLVEGRHDLGVPLMGLDEEGADDRSDDGHAAQHQGIDHRGGPHQQGTQQHGGDHGHRVGLEQVGSHAGAVAHIVAHIVGDDRRVAGVVFGNPGLDLAHQVRAHVGALGEDAAPESGEDGDQGAAEAQAHQGVQNLILGNAHGAEDHVITGNAQQAQTHHQQAGDGAAAEGHLQGGIQAGIRGLRRAHIGAYRDMHTDITGRPGKDGADHEAEGGIGIQNEEQDDRQDDTDDADGGVLTVEIRLGAFLDGGGDLAHAIITIRQRQDPLHGPDAVTYGDKAA